MNKKISSEEKLSIVDIIIKNALAKKTKQAEEEKIFLSILKEKFKGL